MWESGFELSHDFPVLTVLVAESESFTFWRSKQQVYIYTSLLQIPPSRPVREQSVHFMKPVAEAMSVRPTLDVNATSRFLPLPAKIMGSYRSLRARLKQSLRCPQAVF